MRVASEEKGKVRKGFYIEEGVLEQIDSLLQQVNVKSRNEFLNQALKFYIGYLTSEKIENYMIRFFLEWDIISLIVNYDTVLVLKQCKQNLTK